ncbi:hypothetical protein Ciccas_001535 [Cichlidogyrus casuarinus]|uniref:Uncharacterized protein n=1 Tax=Cichlidogyrus casuarinus TaxID=1844966 RepID=A0ABD2QK28_9PLAT
MVTEFASCSGSTQLYAVIILACFASCEQSSVQQSIESFIDQVLFQPELSTTVSEFGLRYLLPAFCFNYPNLETFLSNALHKLDPSVVYFQEIAQALLPFYSPTHKSIPRLAFTVQSGLIDRFSETFIIQPSRKKLYSETNEPENSILTNEKNLLRKMSDYFNLEDDSREDSCVLAICKTAYYLGSINRYLAEHLVDMLEKDIFLTGFKAQKLNFAAFATGSIPVYSILLLFDGRKNSLDSINTLLYTILQDYSHGYLSNMKSARLIIKCLVELAYDDHFTCWYWVYETFLEPLLQKKWKSGDSSFRFSVAELLFFFTRDCQKLAMLEDKLASANGTALPWYKQLARYHDIGTERKGIVLDVIWTMAKEQVSIDTPESVLNEQGFPKPDGEKANWAVLAIALPTVYACLRQFESWSTKRPQSEEQFRLIHSVYEHLQNLFLLTGFGLDSHSNVPRILSACGVQESIESKTEYEKGQLLLLHLTDFNDFERLVTSGQLVDPFLLSQHPHWELLVTALLHNLLYILPSCTPNFRERSESLSHAPK